VHVDRHSLDPRDQRPVQVDDDANRRLNHRDCDRAD
jgi:hypothetical protein